MKKIAFRLIRYLIGIVILAIIIKWFFIFPPRTVYLKAVFDKQYRQNQFDQIDKVENEEEVKKRIKKIISGASGIYEKEFGIKFELKEIDFWAADGNTAVIYELKNDFKEEDVDIVVGFSGRRIENDTTLSGRACWNHVLINRNSSLEKESLLVAHEIGHLFNALHVFAVFSKKSLMKADEADIIASVDSVNKIIIYFYKYKNFHFWLPNFLKPIKKYCPAF